MFNKQNIEEAGLSMAYIVAILYLELDTSWQEWMLPNIYVWGEGGERNKDR